MSSFEEARKASVFGSVQGDKDMEEGREDFMMLTKNVLLKQRGRYKLLVQLKGKAAD